MSNDASDSRSIARQQARLQHEERCEALRALLMTPLMTPAHPDAAAEYRFRTLSNTPELSTWA